MAYFLKRWLRGGREWQSHWNICKFSVFQSLWKNCGEMGKSYYCPFWKYTKLKYILFFWNKITSYWKLLYSRMHIQLHIFCTFKRTHYQSCSMKLLFVSVKLNKYYSIRAVLSLIESTDFLFSGILQGINHMNIRSILFCRNTI